MIRLMLLAGDRDNHIRTTRNRSMRTIIAIIKLAIMIPARKNARWAQPRAGLTSPRSKSLCKCLNTKVYIYIHTYMHTILCIHIQMFINTSINTDVNSNNNVHTDISMRTVFMYMYANQYSHIILSSCIYIYVCVCVRIYIYIYAYVHRDLHVSISMPARAADSIKIRAFIPNSKHQ